MMKGLLVTVAILLLSLAANANNNTCYADTAIKIADTIITIKGTAASRIALVNYAGKPIGQMATWVHSNADTIVITVFQFSKQEGVYMYAQQQWPVSQLKNKKTTFQVKKAFIDPEMKTNPRQYWEAMADVRELNNDISTAGHTIVISTAGKQKFVQAYEGIDRNIPFATKQQADAFVTAVKGILKNK